MVNDDRTWLSREEAADHLRISWQALDKLCRKGIITRYRIGGIGKPKFKRAELDRTMTKSWMRKEPV